MIWRDRQPLKDGVWRTSFCGHRHRSRAAAEQCERRETARNERLTKAAPERPYSVNDDPNHSRGPRASQR
jgi:hypothetical protein